MTINASAPHIASTFLRLSALTQSPVFFTIEVGTHRDVEAMLRKSSSDPLHSDVYYLDGLSHDTAHQVFKEYEWLLCDDGGVKFGIGSHNKRHDEVFVDGYKVFHVYTVEPDKYRQSLAGMGFQEQPNIKTMRETFTSHSPGSRTSLTGRGKTIWDMVEELKHRGLYLAEQRAD